jgi:hypothetical protein
MKEYNRKTKTPAEIPNPKLKKRETCKGGKEHDYILALPWGYEHIDGLYIDAEPVYAAWEALNRLEVTLHQELEKVGIRRKSSFSSKVLDRGVTREYVCSVCGKKKWR